MREYLTGDKLSFEDQQHVLAAYKHRFTGDHTPDWARKPSPIGNLYEVHFADDQEWLRHTRFAVTKDGRLDRRVRYCESNPTWPNRKTEETQDASIPQVSEDHLKEHLLEILDQVIDTLDPAMSRQEIVRLRERLIRRRNNLRS